MPNKTNDLDRLDKQLADYDNKIAKMTAERAKIREEMQEITRDRDKIAAEREVLEMISVMSDAQKVALLQAVKAQGIESSFRMDDPMRVEQN